MAKNLRGYRAELEYNPNISVAMYIEDNVDEMPLHYHNAFEVIFVIDGVCIVSIGGTDYYLLEGDMLFITPGITHSIKCGRNGRHYLLHVNTSLFHEVPESEKLLQSFSSFAVYDKNVAKETRELLKSRMELLWSHHTSRAEYKYFHFYASVIVLFAIAGSANLEKKQSTIMQLVECHSDKHRATLDSICDYINTHCEYKLSAQEIAAEYGFSLSNFYRIFTAYTGKSFGNYVTEQRVLLAKRLLGMALNENIIDIGLHCGFTSVTSFNRAFKEYVGVTPSEFRKMHEGEQNDSSRKKSQKPEKSPVLS